MKKAILYTLALAALLSCMQETGPELCRENGVLYATIAKDDAITKSILLDNPGRTMENLWAADDRIGIFGNNVSNQGFTIDASSLSADGKTARFKSDSSVPKGELTAYSPFQEGAARSGNEIMLDFPAVQIANGGTGYSQPDTHANIMVGAGNAEAGLSFRPVMAVLKFGLRFEQDITLSRVEFRDLSGAPVAGKLKVTAGSAPSAEITGSGTVLTLDLGANGLDIPEGDLHPLFLIVPAREYPKGFELAFITSTGKRLVKDVGTKMGKTLSRGVLYPVGDVSTYEYPAGVHTTLMPGAMIVTPEVADMIHLISIGSDYMRDVNGEAVRYSDSGVVFRPTLHLLVHDDLGLQAGNWLIYDYGSAQVPDGGVFIIETVTPLGGGYSQVFARTEANIAAPFQEVKIGEEMFDADDNEIEGAGVDLDVSSYVRQVLDEDGNAVPFSVSPSGELLFSEEATTQLTGIRTKAGSTTRSVSLPEASLGYSGDHMEASLGAKMSIDFRTAVGFFNGEAQYVYYTAHPSLKLTASFTAKAEVSADKSKRFFKIDFAPIPAAPGVVLIPSLELWGKIGVVANLKFTTSASFTYDMGTYGVSYNKGDGFTVRHKPADPGAQEEIHPEVNGFSGLLNAFAGLSVRPYVSVYGLFGLGLDLDCLLNFSLSAAEEDLSCKLSLYPSLQITPRVITLGGYYTKTIKKFSGSISLDPLWERYLTPSVTGLNFNVPGHTTKTFYKFKMGDSDLSTQLFVPDGYLNYNIKLEGQVLTPVRIGLAILRGSHDDVSFVSVNSGLSDYSFSNYLAAGIPTYSINYSHVLMGHLWDTVVRERVEEVGIYDVGVLEQSFEGSINFTPESAEPYWYGICYIGEDGMVQRQKISNSLYRPYIYLWPTDWWGRGFVPDN